MKDYHDGPIECTTIPSQIKKGRVLMYSASFCSQFWEYSCSQSPSMPGLNPISQNLELPTIQMVKAVVLPIQTTLIFTSPLLMPTYIYKYIVPLGDGLCFQVPSEH